MRSIFAIILLLAVLPAAAQTMNYQGVIENADGSPVSESSWEFEFFIYDVEVGGSPIWIETQILPVENGHFEAQLGSAVPLNIPFDAPYWITFSFDGDPPMEPRLPLSSVPYAFRAAVADSLMPGTIIEGDLTVDASLNTNAFRLGSSAIAGQVLTSDANGVGTWQDAAGGSSFALPYSGTVDSNQSGFSVEQSGLGKGGEFEITSESTSIAALYGASYNDGTGVMGRSYGDGPAGDFANMNVESSEHALIVGSRGSAASFYASNVADGPAALFEGNVDLTGNLDVTGAFTHLGVATLTGNMDLAGDLVMSGDLEVGNSLFTSQFRLGPAATAGQVLTTDEQGYGTWQAAPEGFTLPYSGSIMGAFTAFELTNDHVDGAAATFNGNTNFYGKMSAHSGSYSTLADFHSTNYSGGITLDAYHASNYTSAIAIQGGAWAGTGGYFEAPKALVVKSTRVGSTYSTGIEIEVSGGGVNRALSAWSAPGSSTPQHYGIASTIEGGMSSITYAIRGNVENHAPQNYAGYFDGDTHVVGTLSKSAGSFKIDHPLDPEGKYLSHSFVESPDMMNIYNGNVVLDADGEAWVEMPEWFEALNRDFRYQLTCIGGFAPVYVAEKVDGNRFKIAGGQAGLEVSWQLTGVRQDEYAKAHPIVVEEAKEDYNQGFYLHPELYGASRDRAVNQIQD